tara:strand:+ start:199 stop:849 length:651 start_codon:yes stop_codon:yes gene_type:complete
MKTKKIIAVGAGNTIDELYPIIKNSSNEKKYKLVGILDDNKKFYKRNYKGIPIHIGLENAKKFKDCQFVFGIGSYANKNKREKIFKKMNLDKEFFPNIIDPSAKIENNVNLGYGNIIYPYSVVCSGTKIKNFCVLTYLTILAHNVLLDSFALVGSRTSILNYASVGKEVFFGANVLVAEKIKIGDCARIIMGSVVLTNVPKNQTAFGFPSKLTKNV